MSTSRPSRSRLLASCQLSLAALCLLIAVLAWPEAKGRLSGTFAIFAMCCLAAFWSRSGWIIPGTVFGVLFGMFFLVPPVQGGTAESQMWEVVTCIMIGGAGGLFMGYMIDLLGALPVETPNAAAPAPVASDESQEGT